MTNLKKAKRKAHAAIDELTMFAESKLNFKQSSFVQSYEQIPSLFEMRAHRNRELLIITNASPGIRNRAWSRSKLSQLTEIKVGF